MRSSHDVEKEPHAAMHKELAEETVREAAERGHQATDQYVNHFPKSNNIMLTIVQIWQLAHSV